jgi:hypothetical protein
MEAAFANFQGGGIPTFQNFAFASALTFLASAAALTVGALALLGFLLAHRARLARWLGLALAGGMTLYAALLLGFSATSRGATLPPPRLPSLLPPAPCSSSAAI